MAAYKVHSAQASLWHCRPERRSRISLIRITTASSLVATRQNPLKGSHYYQNKWATDCNNALSLRTLDRRCWLLVVIVAGWLLAVWFLYVLLISWLVAESTSIYDSCFRLWLWILFTIPRWSSRAAVVASQAHHNSLLWDTFFLWRVIFTTGYPMNKFFRTID